MPRSSKKGEKIEEQKDREVVKPTYSEEELKYRSNLIKLLEKAKSQRDASYTEFDDKDYLTWYLENAKVGNSYLREKKNEDDYRIVTGTTNDKEMTLLSAILNYNLEPSLTAYDEQNMLVNEIGEIMEAMVRKSRDIEDYETNKVLIYREFLDQGTVFVEEVVEEKMEVEKELKKKDFDVTKLDSIKWETRLKKCLPECYSRLISGTHVFLGNIKEFFIDKQPYLFTKELVPYDIAKQIYGEWERWEYVPKKIQKFADGAEDTIGYRDWSLEEIQDDMVEIIKYQSKPKNEFMILINGVLMLPPEFPLTAIRPDGMYTISKGDAEPISRFFAYSKSTPAKTKVHQALMDEFLRLMIMKERQSFQPPMGDNTNKNVSRNVLLPGKMTKGVSPDKLQPLITANGITASEFNFYDLLKQQVDEMSVSPAFAGQQQSGNQTATEIIELKKQQMMKLGLTINGVINLEKQLAAHRIPSLIQVWTNPIDTRVDKFRNKLKEVYRTISVGYESDEGESGEMIIDFDEENANTKTPEMIQAEEQLFTKYRQGQRVRKVYINPKQLKNSKYLWNISIVPTEKNTTELQGVLFSGMVQEAIALFGPQSLGWDYIKKRYATLKKEDPEKFFVQPQMNPMGQGMAGQPPQGRPQGMPGQVAQEMGAMLPREAQPTVKNLVK